MAWRCSILQNLPNYKETKNIHTHTYIGMYICFKMHIHTVKPSHTCMHTWKREKTLKKQSGKSETPISVTCFYYYRRISQLNKKTRLN